MSVPCLIVVVSRDVHTWFRESEPVEPVEFIELDSVRLVVHGAKSRRSPEKHWIQDGLRQEVLAALREHTPSRARIVAHQPTCFPGRCSDAWQERLLEEEESLRVESSVEDLQVWSFHHDPDRSPIWIALCAVEDAIVSGRRESEAQRLAGQLETAFRSTWSVDMKSRLALCWHNMMHEFQAFGLTLSLSMDDSGACKQGVLLPPALAATLRTRQTEAARVMEEGTRALRSRDAAWMQRLDPSLEELKTMLEQGPAFAGSTDAYDVYWNWIAAVNGQCERIDALALE